MDRRRFLTAGGGALAMTLGGDVEAAVPLGNDDTGIRRLVTRLRDRAEFIYQRTLRSLRITRPDPAHAAYLRGTSAMAIIESLSHVPIEDQVHPSVQRLTRQLLDDIALSSHAMRSAMEVVADQPEEPPAEGLQTSLDSLQAQLAALDVGEDSKRMNRNGVMELRARIEREGLRSESRRAAKKLAKTQRLATRIHEAERGTGVMTSADPKLRRQVRIGQARWRRIEGHHQPGGFSAAQTLGLLLCGLGMAFGGFVVIVGIACSISCGSSGLLFVLYGALIFTPFAVGYRAIVESRGRRHRRYGPIRDADGDGVPDND